MNQPNRVSIAVGLVGTGLLGSALAERLLQAGFSLLVNDLDREKAEPLLSKGAQWTDTPLADCGRVVLCLYTSEQVEGLLHHANADLREGMILIDTTTGNPSQTAALGQRLATRGIAYLESPIAASSEQTRQGEALAFVAGPEDAYPKCRDLFDALAAKHFHVGTWGAAAKMKLANNLVLGLNRVALAEGLLFAEAVGLDMATTLEVLKQGNAYSTVMDVKGRKMVEGDFTTQARLSQHAKDIRIVMEEARQAGLQLPLSQLHLELLERGEALNLGHLDNSSIIEALRRF